MGKWIWPGFIALTTGFFLWVLPRLEKQNREKRLDKVYAPVKMTGSQIQEIFNQLPEVPEGAIVFSGNSLTYGFPFEQLGEQPFINHGVPGAFASTMLLQTESLHDAKPAMLFLESGINDLLSGSSADEVCRAWSALLDKLSAELGATRIVVQSVLPVNIQKPGIYEEIRKVNAFLYAECMKRGLVFIDIHTRLQQNGKLGIRFSTDGVHLTPDGYAVWVETIKPLLPQKTTN
jgi:hypothetical protein